MRRKSPKVSGHIRKYSRFAETIGGDRFDRHCRPTKEDARTFFKPLVRKTRAKPRPTHRNKKDRKLVWTGRGSMPRSIRQEMKELKIKPDAFLIGIGK